MKIEKKQVFSNLGICLHCILKPAQATFSKETITASNFTLGIQKTLCSTMKHNKNLQKKNHKVHTFWEDDYHLKFVALSKNQNFNKMFIEYFGKKIMNRNPFNMKVLLRTLSPKHLLKLVQVILSEINSNLLFIP